MSICSGSEQWRESRNAKISRTFGKAIPNKCWCGSRIETLISKEYPNWDRRYYRCIQGPRFPNDGHLQEWVEDSIMKDVDVLRATVRKLTNEIAMMKKSSAPVEEHVSDNLGDDEASCSHSNQQTGLQSPRFRRLVLQLVIVTVGIVVAWMLKKSNLN